MTDYLLALDQGTTSSRAILFTRQGSVVSSAQIPFSQYYPQPGWVEHDPLELLDSQLRAAAQCVAQSGVRPGQIAGVGLANQRETALMWERETGKPVGRAIVWQCRRTAAFCTQLREQGYTEASGPDRLLPDAYFSGTKYRWLLEHTPGARRRAERGDCSAVRWTAGCCGISPGERSMPRTTPTAAGPCSLTFTAGAGMRPCASCWTFHGWLPQPVETAGSWERSPRGSLICRTWRGSPSGGRGRPAGSPLWPGMLQAGQLKNTYGTGCFTLMNTGETPVLSQNGLLTCIGWGLEGKTTYILEGSVFNAGSSIQWLRDELGIIRQAQRL